MKIACLALAAAVSLLPAKAAITQFVTADRLYEWCAREDPTCTTYLDGMMDGLQWIGTAQFGFCAPDNLTGRQIVLAFQKYAAAHPAMLHNPAADLVMRGMAESFPCRPISN